MRRFGSLLALDGLDLLALGGFVALELVAWPELAADTVDRGPPMLAMTPVPITRYTTTIERPTNDRVRGTFTAPMCPQFSRDLLAKYQCDNVVLRPLGTYSPHISIMTFNTADRFRFVGVQSANRSERDICPKDEQELQIWTKATPQKQLIVRITLNGHSCTSSDASGGDRQKFRVR